jgi:DNA primase
VLQHPDAVGIDLVRRATQVAFQNPHLAAVRDGVFVSLDSFGQAGWVDRVVAEVPASLSTLVKELVVAPIPLAANKDVAAYCTAVTIDIVERELLRLKTDLIRQSQRTDREAEPAKYRELQVQLVRVEAERRALLPD